MKKTRTRHTHTHSGNNKCDGGEPVARGDGERHRKCPFGGVRGSAPSATETVAPPWLGRAKTTLSEKRRRLPYLQEIPMGPGSRLLLLLSSSSRAARARGRFS